LSDNVFLEFQTLATLDFTLKPNIAQEQQPEQVRQQIIEQEQEQEQKQEQARLQEQEQTKICKQQYSQSSSKEQEHSFDQVGQGYRTKPTPPAKEQFTFFNGVKYIYHQEYIAIFTVSGFSYNCEEQFRQHRKAVLFDDDVRAAQILNTT